MKTRLGQSVLLASSLLVASCVGNNFDNQKLIVGLECDYAPFNWTATTASAYSLPIDGMSYTEERDVSVDFSGAYYVSDLVAVVRGDSDLVGIDSIQDLSGYKVVTQLGTIQDSVIDQIVGVIHQPGTDTFNTAALSVIAGDSDAMIAEYPVARAIVNANPTLAIVEFEVGFTGIDENELSVSVAVADGNSELLGLINDGLSSLTEDMRQAMMDGAISRSGV